MKRKQIIELTPGNRKELERFTKTGIHSVRLVNRAKIILALDTSEGRKATKQEEIAQQLDVSRQTVGVVKREFLSSESVSY